MAEFERPVVWAARRGAVVSGVMLTSVVAVTTTWPGPAIVAWTDALGLHVEHVDGVAVGAAFERLAAHGQRDAGHLVGDGDVVVAGDHLGLGEVGLAQHVARPHRAARGEADRLFGGWS